jgi:hypothetical protein
LRTSTATCLGQLDAIKEAAGDSDAAYLMRTRLRRALLSTARHVAGLEGAKAPELPGHFVLPDGSSERSLQLIEICNRLYRDSEALCQPSEALDVRWRDGWQALNSDLALLRALLADDSAKDAVLILASAGG